MPEPLDVVLAQLRVLLLDPQALVRAVAAGRRRAEVAADGRSSHPLEFRRAELRPVDLRAGRRLQVVRYDERQAHTHNADYDSPEDSPEAAAAVDALLATPYGNWHVETVTETVQVRVTKKGQAQVHRAPNVGGAPEAASSGQQARQHDRTKRRLLDPQEPFLRELGITTADGQVKPTRRDKLRQIEQLLRALEPVIDALPSGRTLEVVDLGCGNAYLTFATYAYLTGIGRAVHIVGVDVKAQAREHNTAVAARLGWSGLSFVEGTIAEVDLPPPDLVLALHACDTATDDALARAVRWRATVVVAAPCCHNDVQRQMRLVPAPSPFGLVTRHGILRERLADTLTDAIRAAILRAEGYRTEVIEFVGTEHTPRNLLIRAVLTDAPPDPQAQADLEDLTSAWTITPALQTRLAQAH